MKRKILLVDDNKDLLLITQIILKGQGYEIVQATSVEEAEHKIKIHSPALILLDVCIHDGEDGKEFCSRLKSQSETNSIRVILMSCYDCDEYSTVGDDFLPKPFDYNELVNKVKDQMMQAELVS